MQEPKRHNIQQKNADGTRLDRIYWTHSKPQMVEYLLWKNQMLRSNELVGLMAEQFGIPVLPSNMAHMLKDLVERGLVVKLGRGLYTHKDSPYA